MKISDNFLIAETVGRFLEDHKVVDISLLKIGGKTTMAEYMVIGTGTSRRHINAVSELLRLELKKLGINDIKIEGDGSSDWVLVDLGSTIVHLFQDDVRKFYSLETLWG